MFNRIDAEEGWIHPREDAEEDLDLRLRRCPSRGSGGGREYILALIRRRTWMCHRVDVPSCGCGGGYGYTFAFIRKKSRMCHRVDAEEGVDVP
jgi:hypothetical protein